MKRYCKIATVLMAILLMLSLGTTAFAYDILDDPASRWIGTDLLADGGGPIVYNADGSVTVNGPSGALTYIGAKFMDSTVTVRFKAYIPSDGGWGAIYMCNNVDVDSLRDLEAGGGRMAFPWYGRGLPLSINIKNNRISLTDSFIEGLRSVDMKTEEGKYRFDDPEVEHTLVIETEKLSDTSIHFVITVDGGDSLDYTLEKSDEHPMKDAGFITFAVNSVDEWVQLLSVEVDDELILPLTEEEQAELEHQKADLAAGTEPGTTEPETTDPETNEPDTNETETNEPETNEPETNEPDQPAQPQTKPEQSGEGVSPVIWIAVGAAAVVVIAVVVIVLAKKKKKS